MSLAVVVNVVEPTHSSEARRAALRLAAQLGFDEAAEGKLALVVTEIATNLVKHARGGKLLMVPVQDGGQVGMDVFGIDKGPGMANFSECLRDGYSTAGSPGTGLGAVVRLSSDSDVFTGLNQGTVIRARCMGSGRPAVAAAKDQRVDVGGIVVPYPGESESGDAWCYRRDPNGVSILVVDGLGHGPEAAKAAVAAVAVFEGHSNLTGVPLIELMDHGLRGTRGAAVAVVDILYTGELLYTGVGNISAVIYSDGATAQHLVSMSGIVGHRMGRARQYQYTLPPNYALVLHSDGLHSRWKLQDYRGLQSKSAPLIAATLLRDAARGTDDATVVVARPGGSRNAL